MSNVGNVNRAAVISVLLGIGFLLNCNNVLGAVVVVISSMVVKKNQTHQNQILSIFR